ncbi:hypothetical protein EON65_35195 [archaeon]|nr:MAG: hypothetical protein EON65_35195 [archaeon]
MKGKTVVVPRDPHFSHPEHKADEWEVETVCQFFEEKLDFPQYQEDIKQLYLNGQSFISLHDDVPFSGFKVAHPLHKIKILSHAERLRSLVIERSMKHESKQAKHYSAADTAAYLLKDPEVPKITAVLALRHNWCAKNLEKVSKDPKTSSKLAPLSDKECDVVIGALCKLIEENPDLIEKKTEPIASSTKADPQPKTVVPTAVDNKPAIPSISFTKAEVKTKSVQPSEEPEPVSKPPEKVAAPPAEQPIDLSAFEADRQLFMQRISSLEQTLSHHVGDMMKLKQKADKLEQEREIVKAQQTQRESNSKVAQKIIDSLVQDRQFVTKELEKITSMYYSQLEREKGVVMDKIERLSTEIVQSKKHAVSKHEAVGIKVPTMAPTEEIFGRGGASSSVYRGGITLDDASDLDSVVEHVLSSSSNGNQAIHKDADAVSRKAMLASSYDSRATLDQESTNISLRNSHSGAVGIADKGPRETVNRTLFVNDGPAMQPISTAATRALNIAQYIQSNVQMEIDLWQKVLKKYKVTGENLPTADNLLVLARVVGDTRQILLELASKWMSVGRAICTQALTKDNIEGAHCMYNISMSIVFLNLYFV